MEVQGKVKLVGVTESVGSNGFRKRDIIVTTDEQYPQHISVQFVQDKCDMLDAYKPGQDVKIGINLRGREWVSPQGETKYFNTIQGWRIESLQSSAAPQAGMPPVPPADAFEPATNFSKEQEDDLPF